MGLFGRKNEFSGRPVATDADTLDDGRTGPNTLHKRGAVPPTSAINPTHTTTATTAEPAPATYGTTGYQGGSYDTAATTGGTIDSRQDTVSRKKTKGGLFGRRNRSVSPSSSSSNASLRQQQALNQHGPGYGTGIGGGPTYGSGTAYGGYGAKDDDPMNVARGKVHAAEAAEREALRMLGVARAAVKEAHEHVERLATQADEEARRAALRQKEVQGLRGDAGHLGQQF